MNDGVRELEAWNILQSSRGSMARTMTMTNFQHLVSRWSFTRQADELADVSDNPSFGAALSCLTLWVTMAVAATEMPGRGGQKQSLTPQMHIFTTFQWFTDSREKRVLLGANVRQVCTSGRCVPQRQWLLTVSVFYICVYIYIHIFLEGS